LHIGDEWVRALLVEVRPENVLTIGVGKERRIDRGPAIKAATLASVCEDALRRAEDMTERTVGYLVVPDEAIVSIPGLYVHSVIGRVQMVRSQPEREIGQRELLRLLSRLYDTTEHLAAVATVHKSGSASTVSSSSFEFLQAKVIEMRVDGYEVTMPIRFRGSKLEAAAVALFAEAPFMDELRLLMTYLELAPTAVATSWAIASCMNEQEALGLVLDSHETTLFLLRRGTVVALERCAFGGEELARDLAVALGLPRFRTDALQDAHRQGELDEKQIGQLEEGMRYSARQWLQSLNGALSRIAEQNPLPHRLCFWEMFPGFPALEQILRGWMETWPLDRFPVVRKVGLKDIPGISERTGVAGGDRGISHDPEDAAAFALAHYAGGLQEALRPLDDLFYRAATSARHGAWFG